MSRVVYHGHGVYCTACQEVYPTASDDPDDDDVPHCEHGFDKKMGVKKGRFDGYIAVPADMGHYSPHQFRKIDDMQQCVECGAVQIPEEMVESTEATT